MNLKIVHHTRYDYSTEVFLDPHYLNFYPQPRPHLKLQKFDLKINPEPSGIFEKASMENNYQHQCWFNDLTDKLHIEVKMEVETSQFNPFGFYHDSNTKISSELSSLYIHRLTGYSEEISSFVDQIESECGNDTIKFLAALVDGIKSNWGHEVRYESNILSVEDCFLAKNGSCRDLTWMMMHILGYRNIPTRFVSGYARNPDLGEGHELHAWLEAYLPGAGWIGLDPSAGLFTTSNYIPTAASLDPKNTMPVIGQYRGEAKSQMKTAVTIEKLD